MRPLTANEIALLDEAQLEMEDEGYYPVEVTIGELAALDVETICGRIGNSTFALLASKGYKHRKCRGWLKTNPPLYEGWGRAVSGMFHIKIQTEKTALKIEHLADIANGSLRFDGKSCFEGFMVFEIE